MADPGADAGAPPPDRLYGRAKGHALRPRQQLLLDVTLPRLAFDAGRAGDPLAAFTPRPEQLWLEVGFGGGEHAVAQAAANPQAGLIACEVFENGVCSLLAKLVDEGGEANGDLPGNLRLWTDDARILMRAMPDACLDRLFLMFPDPWPKSRHAKRRFVHPRRVPEVARLLQPGASWRVASDDPTYQGWVTEVMDDQAFFTDLAPVTTRPEGWPPTRYEAKALKAGRTPLYWCFVRRP